MPAVPPHETVDHIFPPRHTSRIGRSLLGCPRLDTGRRFRHRPHFRIPRGRAVGIHCTYELSAVVLFWRDTFACTVSGSVCLQQLAMGLGSWSDYPMEEIEV